MKLSAVSSYIDCNNRKVTEYLKNKIKQIIEDNEDEFLNCLLDNQSDSYKKLLPALKELCCFKHHIRRKIEIFFSFEEIKNMQTSIACDFKNVWLPFGVITVKQDKIQNFSRFDELKSYCELIENFRINAIKLSNFISDNLQGRTLSTFLKAYPELCVYLKDHFKGRFKLEPYKDPKKHKALPEHLDDYIRKVQFIMKIM
jgi:hypothetical protein